LEMERPGSQLFLFRRSERGVHEKSGSRKKRFQERNLKPWRSPYPEVLPYGFSSLVDYPDGGFLLFPLKGVEVGLEGFSG